VRSYNKCSSCCVVNPGVPSDATLSRMRLGMPLLGREGGHQRGCTETTTQRASNVSTLPSRIRLVSSKVSRNKNGREFNRSALQVEIHEGRFRQIRRMFGQCGHCVLHLKRIQIGPLSLGDLPRGKMRRLLPHEVASLVNAAQRTASGR